ncbi:DUF805 domain-containing protein [Solilutibacter silvestris]|uniref:DUF805 domain-containing protein n=1 Tax=Solilutibacter silvestris TaxID=1645665 RepID=UPI003D34B4C6
MGRVAINDDKVRGMLNWLEWKGRLRRRSFLWRLVTASLVFIVLYVFMDRMLGHASTLLLYLPFFAVLLSLSVRRLHDQAKVAGWLLLLLVPVLGPLLVGFLLLFRRGTPGENQYGDDPRTRGRDYLEVNAIGRA